MPAFSLLTFNCLGAPLPSTRRRLRALAGELNRRQDSAVCLQEVQTHGYARLLSGVCDAYPARASEPHLHAPKGGLLTLSRLPIGRSAFVPYNERSIVSPLALMDWALLKGVLISRLALGDVPLVALNTHLSANYNASWEPDNRYARIERGQLRQLAALVREQPAEALVIACGDLNIPRGSWLYQEFMAASGLADPLAGDDRPTQRLPRPAAHLARPIDFALLRAPDLPGLRVTSGHIFDRPVPAPGGRPVYLSDHIGVEIRVEWDG